jgi:threonine/homoserine/homoserine lactone efflux protein
MLLLFLKGVAIGLAIAAPVGPVAVLCIRRTLILGHAAGFASGAGAVLGDLIFGAIAVFGVAAVTDLLLAHERTLRLIGGLFMVVLGGFGLRRPPPVAGRPVHGSLASAFATAFVLMVTNPITIFAFLGIMAGFGVVTDDQSLAASLWLLGGVGAGATLWWAGLTIVAGFLRRRVTLDKLGWINRVSGAILILFGLIALVSLLMDPTGDLLGQDAAGP